jgi:gliding motility-associated-like protein
MIIDDSESYSTTTNIALYQYDLSFGEFDRTEFLINTYENDTENHLSGALQLGFDKKIYHAILGERLSVINQPNLSRRSADYREFSVELGESSARYGLPSYEQSAFESIISVKNLCFNNPTQFNIIIDEPIQSISWNFGDPASGANNTSNDMSPSHIFTSTGRFAVTMNVDFLNRATKTYIEFIEIEETPIFVTQVELIQCDINGDDGITKFNLAEAEQLLGLPSDELVVTYFESFEDALVNENTLTELGYENSNNGRIIYAKVFVNADCYSIIEVKLSVEPMSNLGEYSNIFVCQDSTSNDLIFDTADIISLLENDFLGSDVSLYNNESNALMEINHLSGTKNISDTIELRLYFRVETFNGCDFIGSINISGATAPSVEDQSTIFCTNETNTLDAGASFWSYLWSTGETSQKIEINSPGNYWVEVSTGINCSDTMNFEAKLSEAFEIIKIEVDDFRPQNTVRILLNDYSGEIEYSLDGITFSNANEFYNVTPGIYDVFVKKDNCHFVKQTVLVGGYPNYFTPNGDGVNDTWKIKQPLYFQEAKINIYDRYGKLLQVMSANDGWDGKHEGNILTPADYWFTIALNNKIVYGHFTLKL